MFYRPVKNATFRHTDQNWVMFSDYTIFDYESLILAFTSLYKTYTHSFMRLSMMRRESETSENNAALHCDEVRVRCGIISISPRLSQLSQLSVQLSRERHQDTAKGAQREACLQSHTHSIKTFNVVKIAIQHISVSSRFSFISSISIEILPVFVVCVKFAGKLFKRVQCYHYRCLVRCFHRSSAKIYLREKIITQNQNSLSNPNLVFVVSERQKSVFYY